MSGLLMWRLLTSSWISSLIIQTVSMTIRRWSQHPQSLAVAIYPFRAKPHCLGSVSERSACRHIFGGLKNTCRQFNSFFPSLLFDSQCGSLSSKNTLQEASAKRCSTPVKFHQPNNRGGIDGPCTKLVIVETKKNTSSWCHAAWSMLVFLDVNLTQFNKIYSPCTSDHSPGLSYLLKIQFALQPRKYV